MYEWKDVMLSQVKHGRSYCDLQHFLHRMAGILPISGDRWPSIMLSVKLNVMCVHVSFCDVHASDTAPLLHDSMLNMQSVFIEQALHVYGNQ